MGKQYCSELKSRRLITISGSEAATFLQGILTCDVEKILSNKAGFSGLLTPQGKILFDFILVRLGSEFILDVDGQLVDDLIKRLTFYKLRADVTIKNGSCDRRVFALYGSNAPANISPDASAIIVADPRLAELGSRYYCAAPPSLDHSQTPDFDYDAHRILIGMPEGGIDYAYGKAFPHEALYDQNGGVDFAKGCYVGQEVVSRMHHRASARKRVVQISSDDYLPKEGTKIKVLDKSVGAITSITGNNGLALLRLDHIKDALDGGQVILADNITIDVKIQPWTNLSWPGE